MSTTKARKPRSRRLLDDFPPDTRIVVAGVTWDDYENLVDQVGEARNCRIAFDGEDIEMMTLGPWHESERSLLEAFIAIVAGELKIERRPMGSTTWKMSRYRGVEFLPVRPEDVTRWVYGEDSTSRVTWEDRLREWVRSELGPRVNA